MKNRSRVTTVRRGYTKVPDRAFEMGISTNSLALYCLCLYVPEDFNPSLKYISDKLKISRSTVFRSFKELVEKGMLVKIETGNLNRVSRYELTNPVKWITKKEDW